MRHSSRIRCSCTCYHIIYLSQSDPWTPHNRTHKLLEMVKHNILTDKEVDWVVITHSSRDMHYLDVVTQKIKIPKSLNSSTQTRYLPQQYVGQLRHWKGKQSSCGTAMWTISSSGKTYEVTTSSNTWDPWISYRRVIRMLVIIISWRGHYSLVYPEDHMVNRTTDQRSNPFIGVLEILLSDTFYDSKEETRQLNI